MLWAIIMQTLAPVSFGESTEFYETALLAISRRSYSERLPGFSKRLSLHAMPVPPGGFLHSCAFSFVLVFRPTLVR